MLSQYLLKKLQIGNRSISNRIVLAPIAGIGHVAFRHLISEFGGAGLLFTGMCSAKAVPHENRHISPVFRWRNAELDTLVCQIFGPDPESMAAAAKRIEQEGFFGVDLNFGCSVAAICNKGCGAALLKTPDLAVQIVQKVRETISIPLFVKFRIGWEDNPQFAVDMARRFEQAGADALTFHPRVSPDRRSRPPQWSVIGDVVKAVSIPVFGNGNIFTARDGIKMLEETSCQGLSIARMAVARPWIFAQWTRQFSPDNDIFFTTALRLTDLLLHHYDEKSGVKLFKKTAPYFCANFKFGHQILKKLMIAQTMDELKKKIHQIFWTTPETLSTPNLNLFA